MLNPADFTNPAPMTFADQPRNAFSRSGYKSVDLSLFKNVEFGGFNGRRSTVQIRVEAFNAFNWTNLNNPTSNTNSANFGRVTSARPMRVVQLGRSGSSERAVDGRRARLKCGAGRHG